ncbi:DoxX family protein [Schaalia naturae]|uniref:DoxX family protein n=1 Tax=Schaalia naturae TaxID=635203 RepID=A0ABW2SPV8_9ACTO
MSAATTSSVGAVAPADSEESILTSPAARKVLAVLRLAVGFIFLWAFLDKAFGLGYSTAADKAWIRGGTPAQGFLGHLDEAKPFTGLFAGIASPVADWLFMLGMLGVGLAVMLGIGTRVAAVSGSIIMLLMWLAEFPPVKGAEAGTNPLVDYHWAYALVLILVALTYAGDTWGLGKWWKSLDIVQKNRWLI